MTIDLAGIATIVLFVIALALVYFWALRMRHRLVTSGVMGATAKGLVPEGEVREPLKEAMKSIVLTHQYNMKRELEEDLNKVRSEMVVLHQKMGAVNDLAKQVAKLRVEQGKLVRWVSKSLEDVNQKMSKIKEEVRMPPPTPIPAQAPSQANYVEVIRELLRSQSELLKQLEARRQSPQIPPSQPRTGHQPSIPRVTQVLRDIRDQLSSQTQLIAQLGGVGLLNEIRELTSRLHALEDRIREQEGLRSESGVERDVRDYFKAYRGASVMKCALDLGYPIATVKRILDKLKVRGEI